jgi:hypothetical protein
VYFGVTLHLAPIVADSPDVDYDPDYGTITADVRFTPKLTDGSVIKATTAIPPTGFIPMPVDAIIDKDGLLKMRVDPDVNSPGTYAPVRLLGNSPALGLVEPLWYDFTIFNVRIDDKPSTVRIDGGSFQAPNGDATVDLLFHMKETGQTAVAITRIAPDAIRQEGANLIFSFDGEDIPDPVALTVVNGPAGPPGPAGPRGEMGHQGPQGPAPTIAVGTVIGGDTAAVVNSGTPSAAVLNFTLPRGATGADGSHGAQGPQGPAGTITIGTVATVGSDESAIVRNVGTPTNAVLDFDVPRGPTGAAGPAGAVGPKGDPGAGLSITGTVDTYAELPQDLTADDAGAAFFVAADGQLYVWTGTAWPADGAGANFQGPKGDTGATGPAGVDGTSGTDGVDGAAATVLVGTVTTGVPGTAVAITNSGTPNAAVLDFTIPQGATGAQGAAGTPGSQGPAGTAATVTVGTVATGPAGSAVSVTNSGDATTAVLNFTIPKGDAGTTDWAGISNKPNFVVADGAGQISDVSLIGFGGKTVRAVGYGDNPMGIRLMRNVAFTNVYFRCATADDAAGADLIVELRKNGVALANSQVTLAQAQQLSGGQANGSWSFVAGDVLTLYVSQVGASPGKGLVADVRGRTT